MSYASKELTCKIANVDSNKVVTSNVERLVFYNRLCRPKHTGKAKDITESFMHRVDASCERFTRPDIAQTSSRSAAAHISRVQAAVSNGVLLAQPGYEALHA